MGKTLKSKLMELFNDKVLGRKIKTSVSFEVI